MLNETKRRALRAAQQVSFVTLAACSGQIAVSAPAATNEALVDANLNVHASDAAVDQHVNDAAIVDAKPSCSAFQSALRSDAGVSMAENDARQCCREFFAEGEPEWNDPVTYYCCYESQLEPGEKPIACTPWGPPMPPAMVLT